jgi:hypothetical protein
MAHRDAGSGSYFPRSIGGINGDYPGIDCYLTATRTSMKPTIAISPMMFQIIDGPCNSNLYSESPVNPLLSQLPQKRYLFELNHF